MNQSLSNLLQLNPLQLPPAPSWWPLAWGWIGLLLGIIFTIFTIVLVVRWQRKKTAPKKAALRIFALSKQRMTPSEAIELVRQAALCYFPRDEIAKLTGQQWYEFLDSCLATPRFTPNATLWQKALYQKEAVAESSRLIDDCEQWIEQALPPKRR